jgi:hypothetical protein
MAEKLLSDRACANAKGRERTYYKNDGNGLRLRVHPNGARYWLLRYQWGGKESTHGLGKYPEVSLEEARRKAREAKEAQGKKTLPRRAPAALHQSFRQNGQWQAHGRS